MPSVDSIQNNKYQNQVKIQYDKFVSPVFSCLNPNNEINCDGVIDNFKQGKTGDCYLLAALDALSNTEEGRKYIKDSVKKNILGSVTVTLKGINKSYTITKFEMESASHLSTGDDDVKAIELAFEKYRKEQIEEKMALLSSDKSGFAALNDAIKGFKIRTGNGTLDDSLNGGGANNFIYIFTGKSGNIIPNEKNKNYKSLSEISDLSSTAMTISFKDDYNRQIVSNHAYAVLFSDEKETVLVNPWDNSKVIKLSTSFVLDNFDVVEYTNFDKGKKNSEDNEINEIKPSNPVFM